VGHDRFRVLRGGSWRNDPQNARAAQRNRNQIDNSNDNNGFRLVLARVGMIHGSTASKPAHASAMTGAAFHPVNQRDHAPAEVHAPAHDQGVASEIYNMAHPEPHAAS
jgi:hypothetical protein